MKDLGQLAYEAYGDVVGWRTWDDREMPQWGKLHDQQRLAWEGAARAAATADRARRQT